MNLDLLNQTIRSRHDYWHGALKTLGAQRYGAALLIAAGLGIITYGLYSFAMARYTKM